MFNLWGFANARVGGIGTLEVVGGEEAGLRFVPLRLSRLEGEVAGPLARLRLTQVFRYRRAECERVLEAVYRFPLPGDAAVTGVRVRFGDAVVATELRDRRQAERAYRRAREEGRQAALLARVAPDVFTLHVAGIRPDEDVAVETRYVQLARPAGEGWSLRVPLTTAPRYVRGDERGSRRGAAQPLAVLRDPGHRFALDLRVAGAAEVYSPTHAVVAVREGGGFRVYLHDGEAVPDRDFVLTWRPAREAARPALQVLAHAEPPDPHLYFLALVTPPARPPARRVPREVILLVDRSGSMSGPKWDAAAWTARRLLASLDERDAFALCLFDHETLWYPHAPAPATPGRLEEARRLLRQHGPRGGTELGLALEEALLLPRAAGARSRHVLVITDAQVTDAERILRRVDEEAARRDPRRTSVVCIDAAPHAYLVHELAERGEGVAAFLTSDPAEEDVATALDDLLAAWERPLWTDLALEVDAEGLQAAGRPVRSRRGRPAIPVGDLPGGRPVWVVGRCLPGADGAVPVRLVTRQGRVLAEAVARPEGDPRLPAVRAVFGARRLLALEHLREAGYPAAEVERRLAALGYGDLGAGEEGPGRGRGAGRGGRAGRAARTVSDVVTALRRLLVRESLAFGLACAETAFVAVREERGRRVEGTVHVPGALPAGWSAAFLTAPAAVLAPPVQAGAMLGSALYAPAACDAGALPPPAASPAGAAGEGTRPDAGPQTRLLFRGRPAWQGGVAVLFAGPLAGGQGEAARPVLLRALRVRVRGIASAAVPAWEVQLFAGDPVEPRARVRLADLLREGGERPLAVRVPAGEEVRVVLAAGAAGSGEAAGVPDPAGAPELEVEVEWVEV